jgi:hypothetical protein
MSWIEKHQPSPFDDSPIPGFFMLHGDLLFGLTRNEQYRGGVRPMIAFPSGSNRALWPARTPEQLAEFYLFGEMALPVHADRDSAFEQADRIALEHGYGVAKVGDHALEVWDERDYDHFRVTYNARTGFVADVGSVKTVADEPRGGE